MIDHPAALRGRRGEDILPQRVAPRKGLLIRRHDADSLAEKQRVGVRDLLVAGVVDDDDGAGCVAEVGEDVGEAEDGLVGGGEGCFPGGEGEGPEVFAEEEPVAARDEDEGEVGVAG